MVVAKKYHEVLDTIMQEAQCTNVEVIQKVLVDAATSPGVQKEVTDKPKPWQSPEIRELIDQRRRCDNSVERRKISKRISKLTRIIYRKYQNEKVINMLEDFADLGRIPVIKNCPVVQTNSDTKIDPNMFAKALGENNQSPDEKLKVD